MDSHEPVGEEFFIGDFFTPDIPEVTAPTEPPKTPETPASAEKPDITEVPEVVPDTPEVPAEGDEPKRSVWSNILLAAKETFKVLPAEVEVADDVSPQKMMEILTAQAVANAANEIEEVRAKQTLALAEKGYTAEQIERGIFYSEHLAEGGSEEIVNRHAYLTQLAQAEIEDEEDELELIRRFQALKGQDEALVETYVTAHFASAENDTEEQKATKTANRKKAVELSRTGISQIGAYELAQDKARAQTEKAQREEAQAKEREEYKRVLTGGIYGIKLTKEQAENQEKAMFNVVGYKEVQTPNGVQKVGETAEAKLWGEVFKDPVKRSAFTYILLNGIENVFTAANKQSSDKFLKAIETSTAPFSEEAENPQQPGMQRELALDGGFLIDF